MSKKDAIQKRYDFVIFFDVKDGNPNGDPDAGNLPRVDAETGHGLITDVCLKRKVRNYVGLKNDEQPPYGIFVKEKAVLNNTIEQAYLSLNIDLKKLLLIRQMELNATKRDRDRVKKSTVQKIFCARIFTISEHLERCFQQVLMLDKSEARCSSHSPGRSIRLFPSNTALHAWRWRLRPKLTSRAAITARWEGSLRFPTDFTALMALSLLLSPDKLVFRKTIWSFSGKP